MIKIPFNSMSEDLIGPYTFSESDGIDEGTIDNPWDIVKMFEPMDVLNGAIELKDTKGTHITIWTTDQQDINDNEYHDMTNLFLKLE